MRRRIKTMITISTRRSCYSKSQVEETLTVRELISILEQYDENTEVCFKNDNGYTYGEIYEDDIEEDEEYEEDE